MVARRRDAFLRVALGVAACAALVRAGGGGDESSEYDDHPCGHDDDHGGHHGGEFHHFNVIFFTAIFVSLVWLSGKLAAAVGHPSLVGEILAGVVLGPHLLDLAPNPAVLKTIGEVGLIFHAAEVGLMVDVELLEIIGARGLAVGVAGSALPMALGFAVARLWGSETDKAFVVGASMASISTGITLNVLKGAVLNQPIGQLIIAAATLNEIVNIALLTSVENMVDGAALDEYLVPMAIMVVLIAVVGALAVRVVPRILERQVLPRVPQQQRPTVVLGSLFLVAAVLIPTCKYSGSSELLGAFLAGLCFCSDHLVHETWDRQVKRVMQWLMRFFDAVREALREDEHQGAEIRVQRWLPGCHVAKDAVTGEEHLELPGPRPGGARPWRRHQGVMLVFLMETSLPLL